MSTDKKILVLGVGNILYTDEGIGVRVVEHLQANYTFADNVTLMDGGTLGNRLIDPIMNSNFLIVVDAVLGKEPPGSVYRLTGDDLRKSLAFKDSMHDIDLVDVLIQCDMIGNKPDAVVVGIEPEDFSTMGLEPTATLSAKIPDMAAKVLEEITNAGGTYQSAA